MKKRNKRRKRSFFKRNKIGIIIFGVLFIYLAITMIKQEIKLNELLLEEQQKLQQIDKLKKEIVEMEKKINESENLDFIEKVAREKLKMVKPNEIIYILHDDKKTD